jgi:hypothetical protein
MTENTPSPISTPEVLRINIFDGLEDGMDLKERCITVGTNAIRGIDAILREVKDYCSIVGLPDAPTQPLKILDALRKAWDIDGEPNVKIPPPEHANGLDESTLY